MRPSALVVKAFDGFKRTIVGEIDLSILIGRQTFYITFQVMDIRNAYSCLLGRPWIHAARGVTSTLHQKLEFVTSSKLVSIFREEDIFVSHLSLFKYIKVNE